MSDEQPAVDGVGHPPTAPPGYAPPTPVDEPVAERAHAGWSRWRCVGLGERGVPDHPPPAEQSPDDYTPQLELRRSKEGAGLIAAARSQARLDGHPGVVTIHRATLDGHGVAEVQLGWAGPTLAGHLAQRVRAGRDLPVADVARIGLDLATALADAHELRPPLIHGALDATAVRIDRWGRCRLDGFGGRAEEPAATPIDDVRALLELLGGLLGDHPPPPMPGRSGVAAIVDGARGELAAGRRLDARGVAMALANLPGIGAAHTHAPPGVAICPTSDDATRSGPLDDRTHRQDAGDPPCSRPRLPDGLIPLRRLARGGHGDVWLAHDGLLGRPVVVKRFHPGGGTASKRELAALRVLEGHPASVECYHVGGADRPGLQATNPSDPPTNLVLTCCDGGPLDPSRPWSARDLAQVGAHIADALGVLHARGLVHGDIKPQNLLVDRWGAVRLADFSVTGPIGATASGDCSPRHAPPEQLSGRPLLPSADLAALAATLYHLGEGHPPLDRGDGVQALVDRRLRGEIADHPRSMDTLPALSSWVMAHLRPDVASRPSGGAAVAAATLRRACRPDANDEATLGGDPEVQVPVRSARRPARRVAAVTFAVCGLTGLAASAVAATTTSRSDDTESRARLVAERLPAPDPLGAETSPNLRLRLDASGGAVLIRTAAPHGRPWVVRRDDFGSTDGLVDDLPTASGPVGIDGRIGDGPVTVFGDDRAALRLPAGQGGISCVRVVTADDPPSVSSTLCWG
ncbi:MAG: protein kinase [Microthrixaceae bacterium]